jgi:hypothetical protein
MKNKNDILLIVFIIVLLVLVAVLWSTGKFPSGSKQSPSVVPHGDTTAEIQGALDKTDTGNLDAEFQSIDKDLNSL